MESLEEEDDERFKKQFSKALEQKIGSEDLEDMWTSAFEQIREDPSFKPTDKSGKDWAAESKKYKATRLTYEQRKQKIADRIAAFKAGAEL
jgi:large subunit ribosomal protein L5e